MAVDSADTLMLRLQAQFMSSSQVHSQLLTQILIIINENIATVCNLYALWCRLWPPTSFC